MPTQDGTEVAAVLSIGILASQSTESEAWVDAVKAMGRAVAAAREGTVSPLNVNVVFQVSGNYTEPEFAGVRTGRYQRSTNQLLVQAAVPGTVIADASQDPDATVRELLLLAVMEAERWARRRRLAERLESLRDLAARV